MPNALLTLKYFLDFKVLPTSVALSLTSIIIFGVKVFAGQVSRTDRGTTATSVQV